MPVIVDCRSCGRKLRVADDLLGRNVQCPSCGETFHAEESAAEPPPVADGYRAGREDAEPVSMAMDREPAADEDDDRPWERPQQPQVRRDCEPERGGVVLTLGVVSLFLPVLGIFLGLAAWIMGAKDLGKMRKGQMDPRGQGTTQAGLICGIVGMILQMLLSLCVGVYIAFIVAMVATVSKPARISTPPPPPALAPMEEDFVPVQPTRPRTARRRGK